MGTRGAIGIRSGGKEIWTYNHFDSYPDYLGSAVIEEVRKADFDEWRSLTAKARPVKENAKPTARRAAKAQEMGLVDMSVGQTIGRVSQSANYYQILRNAQGSIDKHLRAGFFVDVASFLQDSLFCEYAYCVNLDDGVLEFYVGGYYDKSSRRDGPPKHGRYKDLPPTGDRKDRIYPVGLHLSIPLAEVLDTDTPIEALVERMNNACDAPAIAGEGENQ